VWAQSAGVRGQGLRFTSSCTVGSSGQCARGLKGCKVRPRGSGLGVWGFGGLGV
jgi:hypothetical protein